MTLPRRIPESNEWVANILELFQQRIYDLECMVNALQSSTSVSTSLTRSKNLFHTVAITPSSNVKVEWLAGTITLDDGRTQAILAGNYTLVSETSCFLYCRWGNSTLQTEEVSANMSTIFALGNIVILAVFVQGADVNEYGYLFDVFGLFNRISTTQINANSVRTANILNSNVTYEKIRNVSASPRFLGRKTADAGIVEEIAYSDIDHGNLADLSADDHTQYVKHSLATAASDFLVGVINPAAAWVKKTLAQTLVILTHTHADAANCGTVDHANLTNVTTSQHHVKYTDAEALAAAWANINTKNFNNLLVNGSFEIGDPPTRWALAGADATLSRSSTQAKIGTYSAKLTRVGADCYCYQIITPYTHLKGRQVTFGCWVYATVASRVRIQIWDGVAATQSSFHTGSSTLEWLTVTATIDANATGLQPSGLIQDGNTDAYFDGAICVEGNSCPAFYPDTVFPLTLTFGDTLTIDTDGVITVTNSFHNVDTFEGAATDNLDTINGGFPGYFLVISPLNTARTIVVKHGTGNIYLEGSTDFVMDDNWKTITLMYHQSVWFEVSRSSQDDLTQFIKHSLATAANDFLVASGAGAFIKKTLAETKTILGMGNMANVTEGIYTGTGADLLEIDHGLGVVPKLVIISRYYFSVTASITNLGYSWGRTPLYIEAFRNSTTVPYSSFMQDDLSGGEMDSTHFYVNLSLNVLDTAYKWVAFA